MNDRQESMFRLISAGVFRPDIALDDESPTLPHRHSPSLPIWLLLLGVVLVYGLCRLLAFL
jgi:hypothetical protein